MTIVRLKVPSQWLAKLNYFEHTGIFINIEYAGLYSVLNLDTLRSLFANDSRCKVSSQFIAFSGIMANLIVIFGQVVSSFIGQSLTSINFHVVVITP